MRNTTYVISVTERRGGAFVRVAPTMRVRVPISRQSGAAAAAACGCCCCLLQASSIHINNGHFICT